MDRITGTSVRLHLPFFQAAALIATEATCHQARCGAVIVRDGEIIARGYNGPPGGLESNRTCGRVHDRGTRPKYDITCCVHAEWQAILNACKTHGTAIEGATLYFMRIDEDGAFTDAGEPYCTDCSRLALASGLTFFALWDSDGVNMYGTAEYDQASYEYHAPTT